MANKRLADNVHKIKGTFQKCRHGDPDAKVKIDTGLPIPPRWLGKDARFEWKRICKVMAKINVITEADASTLSQYCMLYAELKEWKDEFLAAHHTQLRLCAAELGLTPSARSKLTMTKAKENPFDDI